MEIEAMNTLEAGPAILAYKGFDYGIAAWLTCLRIEKVENAITTAD